MWIISGPFDGVGNGVVDFSKQKLLKCGRTYPLGRKFKHPLQLVVNHQKVSGEHFSFIVGQHSTEDVMDFESRPTLTLFNHRSKIAYLERSNSGRITINPLSQVELQDGDGIVLIVGTKLTVQWKSIYCYLPPKSPSFSFEQLASLGIKVTSSLNAHATHHLAPSLVLTPNIAYSLVSGSQLVRPDWLTEVLKFGDDDDTSTPVQTQNSTTPPDSSKSCPLEREFTLPSESRFRPPFAPTLPAELKKFNVWEPNKSRAKLLKGWRFLFLTGAFLGSSSSKGATGDTETRQLVELAGGEYDTFDVSGGRVRLKQAVGRCVRKFESEKGDAAGARGKGAGICVVSLGEVERVRASVGGRKNGDKEWNEAMEVLEIFGLRVVAKNEIVQSIVDVGTSRLDSSAKNMPTPEEPQTPTTDTPTLTSAVFNPLDSASTSHKQAPGRDSAEVSPSPITPVESAPAIAPEADTSAPARKRPVRRTTRSRATTPAAEVTANVIPNITSVLPTPAPSAGVESGGGTEASTAGTSTSGPPRRALTRRRGARATTPLFGLDEALPASTSEIPAQGAASAGCDAGVPPVDAQVSAPDAEIPPPTAAPRSCLKRRLRTDSTPIDASNNPLLAALEAEARDAEEMNAPNAPPLKKFKALFEETDPSRVKGKTSGTGVYSGEIESQMIDTDIGAGVGLGQSQFGPTQTQSRMRGQEGTSSVDKMPIVIEEEEDPIPSQAQSGSGGTASVDDDIQMANSQDMCTQPQERIPDGSAAPEHSATQRRQVTFTSTTATRAKSVQPSQLNKKSGPDTDDAFLKALSQRRSKSKAGEVDDAFDRDFNNLRLAKPDLDGERERALEREREEWKVLAEFGDDSNVRGNFMVVVEFDMPNRSGARQGSVAPCHSSGKLLGDGRDWRGKPDFKKFKKTQRTAHRVKAAVDLILTQENDFGVGTSYWKGSNTQSQSQSQSQPTAQSQLADTSGFGGYRQTQNHLQPSQVDNNLRSQQTQQQGRSASSKPSSKSSTKPPSKSRTSIQAPTKNTRQGKSRRFGGDELDKEVGAESEPGETPQPQPRVTKKGRNEVTRMSATGKGKAPSRASTRGKSQALFLDSEEEEGEKVDELEQDYVEGLDELEDSDEGGDVAPTRKSKTKTSVAPPSGRGRKRVVEVLDDDSGDGMTFGGFGGRKRAKGR